MDLDVKSFVDAFDLLAKQGVIGQFDHFEIIELICFEDDSLRPINVFTIVTAIENGKSEKCRKLNEKRIKLAVVKNRSFGIFKSVQSVSHIKGVLKKYFDTQVWKPNGKVISVGELQPLIKQFIPPNASTDTPLNQVLKNNFFNGSYVLELGDSEKYTLQDFFIVSTILQKLSEVVSSFIPIKIASLADRLGNIIIQFPIEAIRTSFQSDGLMYSAEVAWHPNIPERDLILTAYTEYDHSIVSFNQTSIRSGHVPLSSDPGYGFLFGTVWDSENNLLLASTGELAFTKTITMNMNVIEPEPRTFPNSIENTASLSRIQLSHRQDPIIVGSDQKSTLLDATRKRIYEREIADLTRQRKFIQYGAGSYSKIKERERALNDIRSLVTSHGAHGVCLWDPYLAPQDIVDTLFQNPTFGAPMKALTSLEENKCHGENTKGTTKDDLFQAHGQVLEKLDGNLLGLNIEYRSGHGPNGWKFHDRFLIFPKSNDKPAKAWSLGTSVNGLGKSHHILQQVDNAQLIVDAFHMLWTAVSHQENLIWQCP